MVYICNGKGRGGGTKGGNTHLVSSETVRSQRTPRAKGGFLPPQPSRNQKQSLTPHAPSSRPAAALPAAQSQSAQVGMHIYTRSQPLAIVLHSIMQRSPLANRWRQCPDGPVRRRACQLVTFFRSFVSRFVRRLRSLSVSTGNSVFSTCPAASSSFTLSTFV